MRKTAVKIAAQPVQFVPCVLKLDKRKFACYVEEYIDRVPPLGMAANAVKIFSKRKKAWRTAIAMALALRRADRHNGRHSHRADTAGNKSGSKSSRSIRA